MSWALNGSAIITHGGHFQTLQGARQLLIVAVQPEDAGIYTCSAEREHFTDDKVTASALLHVTGKDTYDTCAHYCVCGVVCVLCVVCVCMCVTGSKLQHNQSSGTNHMTWDVLRSSAKLTELAELGRVVMACVDKGLEQCVSSVLISLETSLFP